MALILRIYAVWNEFHQCDQHMEAGFRINPTLMSDLAILSDHQTLAGHQQRGTSCKKSS